MKMRGVGIGIGIGVVIGIGLVGFRSRPRHIARCALFSGQSTDDSDGLKFDRNSDPTVHNERASLKAIYV